MTMSRIPLQWIRDYYRDATSLFFGLIFPLVMVAGLGNMLTNYDNPDARIDAIKIACYAETGTTAAQTADVFTDALGKADGIEIAPAKSARDAERSVDDKEADVAMIFDGEMNVTVYEGDDSIKNRAAGMIAKGFARESAAYLAAYSSLGASDPNRIAAFEKRLGALADEQGALTADMGHEGREQSMMDFYAVTMVIMICFMGSGIGGASSMFMMRREGLLRRLTVSPRRGGAIFLESVLGGIPGNLAQAAAVMVPATLFLGARYAADPAGNALLFAFFVLLGTTVMAAFMLLGVFMKVNPYLPVMAILWTMLFLSGSFARQMNIPGVSEYLPMNIANRAAFELTMFGRTDPLLTLMAVLAAILAASCLAGSLLMKRKEIAL
jgi:ABC-2 type transport system permease protein